MPLPNASNPVWQRLARGSLTKLKTQNLGIQLMAKRLERSPVPVNAKATEVYEFFVKWERVLHAEIQQLANV